MSKVHSAMLVGAHSSSLYSARRGLERTSSYTDLGSNNHQRPVASQSPPLKKRKYTTLANGSNKRASTNQLTYSQQQRTSQDIYYQEDQHTNEQPSLIDFSSMTDAFLQRYCRRYQIAIVGNARRELETKVRQHFAETNIDETNSVACFIYALRHSDNVYKLDMQSNLY
ncbi:hypothetical protein BATDEDRAFT_21765 [Batrachochytrium dendrobatidis JAM81]|uniref:Histone deacetylase complex subunit SAP30 Sin3 binding domain-containing protein n=2 Tax=Batrachochytrium dendrobatidis TaxID=109871 RepID=F4NV68_BATDJ|nr:uncharacterized protein BATDEDRAFT_21765 [Batrachochytrium dendrobatidis JAM81]EGF83236.1 hypothetical protein BATDEDRAFT_21765 [Batrachochytrium dendrobatidis JAM81]KAJ8325596.1 hypothetical protein O5D80_005803 [Batrachochytrium dendrobatidis]OAJ36534.1 hypothetical protein BDEG_20697 [Batrachochytrium dendrobatidis JEL423]|eukprot:XP_006675376.1 hypothetical protein BATDEDRAFT_21765 [Batrachochytrium dendrobatidis JAM81]